MAAVETSVMRLPRQGNGTSSEVVIDAMSAPLHLSVLVLVCSIALTAKKVCLNKPFSLIVRLKTLFFSL